MKRFLCFLLVFSMLCFIVSMSVSAEDTMEEVVSTVSEDIYEPPIIEGVDTSLNIGGIVADDIVTPIDPEEEAELDYYDDPPIASGTYYFQSVYNWTYMDTEGGGTTAGTEIQQWSASPSNRNQMYKIEWVGFGNLPAGGQYSCYIIRPLTNCGMALTASSDGVTLEEVSSNNLEAPWTQHWAYVEDSGCVIWMNAATGEYISVPENTTNGSALEMTTDPQRGWWQLSSYTGAALEAVVPKAFSYSINTGLTYGYKCIMYSTTPGENGPVTYSVSDPNGQSTIKASINSTTGALTTVYGGIIQFTATYSGASEAYVREITITMPCSGYEIAYNPSSWSGNICLYSNCYNYALNILNSSTTGVYRYMQPGRAANLECCDYLEAGSYNGYYCFYQSLYDGNTIASYAMADADALGFTMTPIGRDEVCPDGAYKVALVIDSTDDNLVEHRFYPVKDEDSHEILYYCYYPDTDYHWYRQNPDGTWSHKRGGSEVTNLDASGNIIYDPSICDRTYDYIYLGDNGMDYSIIVGYFAIIPLN